MKQALLHTSFFNRRVLLGGLAALIGAAFVSRANAALVLTINQTGSSQIVVNDNGTGDLNSAPGTITWQEAATGGLSFSLVTGMSNSPGNPTQGTLSQTEIAITNSSLSSVTISAMLNDDGFTDPVGSRTLLSNITVTFSGTTSGDTATLQSMANSTSTPTQTLTASGNDSQSVAFLDSGTYSLQDLTTLTLAAGATAVVSDSTSVVPEPLSLSVLGLGIAGLLLARKH